MKQLLRVGDKAPDFTLSDVDGKETHLSQFLGKNNVFLIFNRGFA